MQSLEVDLLLRVCPDEEDTIHQIVNLLVDFQAEIRPGLEKRSLGLVVFSAQRKGLNNAI